MLKVISTGVVPARKGRGKSQKTLAIRGAAVRILEEIQPASVRAVCYRLFTLGLIDSMAKGNTNRVSRILVEAREDGLIPWGWLVDETREAERVASWDSPDEIIEAAVGGYRKNYWRDQPAWIEVWSEKGTVRGTLAPVLNAYGLTFRVMHGYGSATALHDIAEMTADSAKRLKVLYVGDWDPSGMHMSEVDLPERLDRYGANVDLARVALDRNDVRRGKLPFFPAESKSGDPRCAAYIERYGTRCWELDALSPVILRKRVERHVLENLDIDAWNHAIRVEQAERDSMAGLLTSWKASISVPASKYSDGA